MRRAIHAVVLAASLLAGCGGGGSGGGGGGGGSSGSGTLYVSFYYGSTPIDLFVETTVAPQLSGFDGHQPNCTLVSGSPPPGMQLQGDCSVKGRPVLPGSFTFTARVGAAGVANSVEQLATVKVAGPSVMYPIRSSYLAPLLVGGQVNEVPLVTNWNPPAGFVASWSYALTSGSLPPGLSLDGATGAIVGTPQVAGAYYATVQARMTTAYGSYEPTISNFSVSVDVPTFGYTLSIGNPENFEIAYVSQPFSMEGPSARNAPPGSTLSAFRMVGSTLPAGLVLDPATGRISGVATAQIPRDSYFYDLEAVITSNGVSSTSLGHLALQVRDPFAYTYPGSSAGRRGAPLTVTPALVQASPVAPSGLTATWTESPDSGCQVPPGMALDGATGVLAGTPTAAGTFLCFVRIAITNNGIPWTQNRGFTVVIE